MPDIFDQVHAEAKGDVFDQIHAQTQPRGSAVSRAVSNWWEEVNPVNTVKGLASAVMHPIDTLNKMEANRGALEDKSAQEAKKGNYGKAFGYGVASLVPFLGPDLAHRGEQAASGDIAGAAGGVAGIATNLAAPALLKRARVPVAPGIENPNPTLRAAVESEMKAGVPVPASVATGNTFVRIAQRAAETTPGGSVVGDAARQSLAQSLAARGRSLAEAAYPKRAMVPATAGEAAEAGVNRVVSRLRSDAESAYGDFHSAARDPRSAAQIQTGTKTVSTGVLDPKGNPITSTVPITDTVQMPVDVSGLKTKLQPIFDEMQWMPAAEKSASAAYQAVKNIIDGPDVIAAEQAERGLSGLKSMARVDNPNLRNTGQGVAAGIVPDLQNAIDSSVAKYGGGKALQQLRNGRAIWAEKMEAADVLERMRKEPVQLFNQMTYAHDAGVEQLKAIDKLAPGETAKAGRAFVTQLIDQATAEGSFAKGGTLFSKWDALGPQTKKILYKNPMLRQNLDNFFLVEKKISEEINPSQSAVVGHSLGSAGLMLVHPVTGIAYNIGAAALTKMLYSPAGSTALMRGLKMPLRAPGAAMAAGQILKMAGSDVTPIQLPQAATDQSQPTVPLATLTAQ